jgi:hypothetical protein
MKTLSYRFTGEISGNAAGIRFAGCTDALSLANRVSGLGPVLASHQSQACSQDIPGARKHSPNPRSDDDVSG